ncbi:YjbF family lipoprotein [Photobacterium makurazakiensis]|uniref:YjbF family lipoprotein n=1 Tax=Photobacterium makurazakiensis TaxID=2910234 RepID=UPI003D0E2B63
MRLFTLLSKATFVSFVVFTLAGCSQKFNDVNDTMSLALFGDPDAQLQADDVTNLPYASIYARIDEGPQAFMVLALAEHPTTFGNASSNNNITNSNITPIELKWLSSDGGMLITQSGRLVKTLNLPQGNVVSTVSQQADPLTQGLHLPNTPRAWKRTLDWQPGYHFGYTLTSLFSQQDNEVVIINEQPIETLRFNESVYVEQLDIRYQNQYWLEPTTGNVIKSRQKLAPGLPYIDITVLKPFS